MPGLDRGRWSPSTVEIDRRDITGVVSAKSFRDEIHRDDAFHPTVLRHPCCHVADGPEAEYEEAPPAGTAAYSTACHAVGTTSERCTKAIAGRTFGHLIGP